VTSIFPSETAATSGVLARDLPRILGEDVLSVAVPSNAAEGAPVGSIGILDDAFEQCDLVLAVGPATRDLPTRIVEAARRGARVVVTDPVPDDIMAELHAVAVESEVCVLERIADVPWLALSDLIRDAIRHVEADDIRASGVTVAGLPGLADSLAEMLGGPVIIEDAKFRVLSYSSVTDHVDRGRDAAILGRRIPDEWLQHLESLGVIETLLGTSQVIDVEHGPFAARRRLLCSIRAEKFLLGILWVAEGDTPLPDDIRARMAAAARAAAPLLLRHQEAGFSERSARDRQLRRLLDAGTISHSAAEECGLLPASHYTLLALRISPDALLSKINSNRMVDSIDVYCQSYRWRSTVTAVGHTIYCLLAHDEHLSDRVKGFANSFGSHVGKAISGHGVRIALSRSTDRLQDVPSTRRQVDQVLETVSATTAVSVREFDDALPQIILSMVNEFLKGVAIDFPKLERLEEEDKATGSDYLTSLRVYLSSSASFSNAARRLNIHVTTLRYRMNRIATISGINLDDPTERLVCELLLHARHVGSRPEQRS
jgi:DNA-binding PucR family transcriptional regulator